MEQAVVAGAAVANAAVPSLQYLEHKFNAPFRRYDLASENRQRLKRVQQLIESLLKYVDFRIEGTPLTMNTVRQLWLTLKNNLMNAQERCARIDLQVRKASLFSRVDRAKDELDVAEKQMQQFLDYAKDIEKDRMSALDSAQSGSQNELPFLKAGSVPVNPPRLTLNYDSPHTFEGKLRSAVIEHSTQKLLAVVASGRGGIGKSCALRGLADDPHVELKFPDGVQFMTLGKDADINTLIQKIAQMVECTGDGKRARDIRACKQLQEAVDKARVWFRARKCLFLVDDVWKQNGIDGDTFYVLADMVNADSRLVYTTRDMYLAQKAHECIEFKARKMEDSRTMFMKHAGFKRHTIWKKENREALQAILDMCAGVPLLLAVAGAGVRQCFGRVRGPKEDALSVYHGKLGRNPETLYEQNCDRYGPVSNVVDTSISVLENRSKANPKQKPFPFSIREMHQSLCVVKKQQEVPVSMLQRLWGLRDKKSAVEVMHALEEVAVVEVEDPRNGDEHKSVLRVHDDILHVLLIGAKDRKRVYFKRLLNHYLPGVKVEVGTQPVRVSVNAESFESRKRASGLNLKRLCCWGVEVDAAETEEVETEEVETEEVETEVYIEESSKVESRSREWWRLEDEDGYIEDNVCRLLREAGEVEELTWLLLKPQWIVKRLRKRGIFAVEHDISIGIGVVDGMDTERKEEKKRSLEVIAHAARLSHHAVERNPREAWFQLYGRLLQHSEKCETTRLFIEEVAQCAERPWAKPGKGILTAAGGVELGDIAVEGDVTGIVETDNGVKICSAEYGKQLRVTTYNMKYGSRNTVTFSLRNCSCWVLSGDGRTVITGSAVLTRWDADTGEKMSILPLVPVPDSTEDYFGFDRVACSDDGSRIVARTANRLVVWEAKGCTEGQNVLTGNAVRCVAVSANGETVACGGNEGEIWMWNAENEAVCESVRGHSSVVNHVTFNMTGELMASMCDDGGVRIWNSKNGAAVCGVDVGYGVENVALIGGGGMLSMGYGKYGVWQQDGGRAMAKEYQGHLRKWASCVTVSADGTVAYFGGHNVVQMRELRSGGSDCARDLKDYGSTCCHEVSSDGRWVVTGSVEGAVWLWDCERGAQPYAVGAHECAVFAVAMSEDARRVVSISRDERMSVWDVDSRWAVERVRIGIEDAVDRTYTFGMAISADGSHVACVQSYRETVVVVWQLADKAGAEAAVCMQNTLQVDQWDQFVQVHDVALSAGGEFVATATSHERYSLGLLLLRVFTVRTGACTHTFNFLAHSDLRLSFSRNVTHEVIVSISAADVDGRLVELHNASCIAASEPLAFQAAVGSLSFWPPLPQRKLRTFTISSARGALVLGTPESFGLVYRSPFGFLCIRSKSVLACQLVT